MGLEDEPHVLTRLQSKILQGAAGDVNAELRIGTVSCSAQDAQFRHPGAILDDTDPATEYIARADAGGSAGGYQNVSGAHGK